MSRFFNLGASLGLPSSTFAGFQRQIASRFLGMVFLTGDFLAWIRRFPSLNVDIYKFSWKWWIRHEPVSDGCNYGNTWVWESVEIYFDAPKIHPKFTRRLLTPISRTTRLIILIAGTTRVCFPFEIPHHKIQFVMCMPTILWSNIFQFLCINLSTVK